MCACECVSVCATENDEAVHVKIDKNEQGLCVSKRMSVMLEGDLTACSFSSSCVRVPYIIYYISGSGWPE